MQYLCLIYADEKVEPQPGTAEFDEMFAGFEAFGKEAGSRGVLQGGNALQEASTATTVRVRDGKVQTTDGPFAETKEQLGGYYLLDCKDLDEALELAAKIPSAAFGSIEVRPIRTFD